MNTNEPQPPAVVDPQSIPRELDKDVDATREWVRLVPMLRSVKQITEADRAALIALCLEWSLYKRATVNAKRRPMTTEGRPSPWFRVARQAVQHCLRLWPELGLTPSSRSRVKIAETPQPGGDSFSEFDEAFGEVAH